jgi:hypothetical protein
VPTADYYSEGHNRIRGDLKQLAATLNKSLKRSPGAYARAFLFSLRRGVALADESVIPSVEREEQRLK